MADPHKLQKPMLLALIGKSPESEEFKTILNVLGEPEEIDTFEDNLVYYTWRSKGIIINFVDNKMNNIMLFIEPSQDYPYTAKEFIYQDDWDYHMTKEQLIELFGEPTRLTESTGYSALTQSTSNNVMTYQNDKYRISYNFTPTNWNKVTQLNIGLPREIITL